jgi:hypothetical protein
MCLFGDYNLDKLAELLGIGADPEVKELIQAFIHQALPLRGSGFRCLL